MHVGLVIYGSLDTLSGGYLYDRRLVAYLEQQGDRVTILARPWRDYGRHLTDNTSAEWRRRLADDYDVLLQDELVHPSLAWVNGRLPPGRPPLVAVVHHLRGSEARPAWQNRYYQWVERRYLRSVDAFIYNSQTTRRAVEDQIDAARPGVVATPGGDRLRSAVSVADVKMRAAEGPLRLIFVGNVIPRKGLHVLLAALPWLRGAWRLNIVGRLNVDSRYAASMRRRAATAGLSERIVWRGDLSDAELAAEMSAAHVLVVPSSYEGFGIVYLEGMGFGLPAVGTTAGAAGEMINDGQNGYLIAPDDAAGLAQRLEALASDRALLARLGTAALETYHRSPTWAETTAAIRAFLVDVVQSGKG